MAKIKLSPRKEEKTLIKLSPPEKKKTTIKLSERKVRPIGQLPPDGLRYLPATRDKKPTETVRGNKGYTLEQLADEDNILLIIPKGYILIDFDDQESSEIMLKIINDYGIKTRTYKTTRGIHCMFKLRATDYTNGTYLTPIDLPMDIKNKNNTFELIKQDGVFREVIHDVPLEECQFLPAWLTPYRRINTEKDLERHQLGFLGMSDGDGRNSALNSHRWRLQGAGLSEEDICLVYDLVSDYLFKDPLDADDLKGLKDPKKFMPEHELMVGEFFDVNGKFLHNALAEYLIGKMHVVTRGETTYVYDFNTGYYVNNVNDIERKIQQVYPNCGRTHRAEVRASIDVMTKRRESYVPPRGDERYTVNVLNGRLNLRTGELYDHSPLALDYQQVPVEYDPYAKCPEIDAMLERVFQGDKELEDLFDEIVGYSLMRTLWLDKFFIFVGEGRNGKSTVIELLRKFVGEDNATKLDLNALAKDFQPHMLENKLLNAGDDISNQRIKDSSVLKKIVSGEPIVVERKGVDAYEMWNFATLIYGANEIPRIFDNTTGLRRRMVILPFNAKFEKGGDCRWRPDIVEEILEAGEMGGLLNRAIRGAQRLIKSREFTIPKVSIEALDEYNKENSIVETWLSETGTTKDTLLGYSNTPDAYDDFRSFLNAAGIDVKMSSTIFYREIKRVFGLSRKKIGNTRRFYGT